MGQPLLTHLRQGAMSTEPARSCETPNEVTEMLIVQEEFVMRLPTPLSNTSVGMICLSETNQKPG